MTIDAALRRRPRIGLALGGGIARGWAHIGVIHALRRLGIEPAVVAGTSIGAVVGGAYLSGHLDALEAWARRTNRLRLISYLDVWLGNGGGLIGGTRIETDLRKHLGDTRIDSLPGAFVAIASDLVSGHEVWLREGPLVDAMRASFALPGIFPPCMIDGRWLVDGALVNPVPVSACRALGADLVIAVNLSADILAKIRQPGTAVPHEGSLERLFSDPTGGVRDTSPDSPFTALSRRLFRSRPGTPNVFSVMISSLGIIIDRITRARLAAEPPDVQIEPRLGHIGLVEFDRAAEVIAEGEVAVERAVPQIIDAVRAFGRGVGELD